MPDSWLALMSDAIKILGPAFFTAIVAIYTIKKQSSTSLETQKLQLRMDARKQLFEFYRAEMIRAEENADKASHACGQLIGIVSSEDTTDVDSLNISRDMVEFFSRSSAVVPLTSNKIIKELSNHTDDYTDFLDLLSNKTHVLQQFPTPIPRSSYKDYAICLADVLQLQGQCYSALMEIHAIDSMNEYQIPNKDKPHQQR